MARKPSLAALNRGQQQLLDIAGDGTLNLVQFEPAAPGFYERALSEGWGSFRTFRSLPVLNWKDPNLKFVDVTGDGIADILITEDDAFLWHESLLDEGFGPAIRVTVRTDECKGPHVIFADGIQSIYLADMSGDGLTDLVRIRNGEVCYWPNLGYGVFGAKVVMNSAPWFDDDDVFDQSRVKLADTDGSGCTDIVYLGSDGIQIYLNEAGNGWSDVRRLPQFAPAQSADVGFSGRLAGARHSLPAMVLDLARGLAAIAALRGSDGWAEAAPAGQDRKQSGSGDASRLRGRRRSFTWRTRRRGRRGLRACPSRCMW